MKKFDFSKEFGNIDPKYISEAEGEWKEKKNVWIASFWSKLAAACVILALISTVFPLRFALTQICFFCMELMQV